MLRIKFMGVLREIDLVWIPQDSFDNVNIGSGNGLVPSVLHQ